MSRPREERRFRVRIPVRFRDLDVIGHVNNAVYFSYMEEARTRYWQELHHQYSYDILDFVVARAECDFQSALRLNETVRVEVWIARIGRTSFDFEYALSDEDSGRVVAVGRTVQVMVHPRSGRPREIEPDLRERMRSFSRHWGHEPDE